jgi:hypothetical protein
MASKNFIRRLIESLETNSLLIWLYVALAILGSLAVLLEFVD